MPYGTVVRRIALVCALPVLFFSTSAHAGGPPWISVEIPGDPTNQSSRGAVMLVRAYSCGEPTPSPVAATADGLVAGERRTIELVLEPAGSPGVYAVRRQWPSDGTWVLTFRMSIGGDVSTLVTLGPDSGDGTPGATVRTASIQVIGRKATSSDVDKVLRAAVTGVPYALAEAQPATMRGIVAGGVGLVALVAGSAGMALGRRRRGRAGDDAR